MAAAAAAVEPKHFGVSVVGAACWVHVGSSNAEAATSAPTVAIDSRLVSLGPALGSAVCVMEGTAAPLGPAASVATGHWRAHTFKTA